MFKKLLNFIKINKSGEEAKKTVKITENVIANENIGNKVQITNQKNEIIGFDNESITEKHESDIDKNEHIENIRYELTQEEIEYINLIKIKRGKRIKAIDIYTNEEIIFENFKECSKKLGVPIQYIKENLKYGYTDFFGDAISFLSKQLRVDLKNKSIVDKNIIEKFNFLHNQLWSSNISELKREEILSSEKIEPIHMHYKFETLDFEYDNYYEKYGKIIRRGGKKKIELIDKKNEVVDVFKSLEECAAFFGKNKSEIIERLKCGECKMGRYKIKYSLRK